MNPKLTKQEKLKRVWWTHLLEDRIEFKIEDREKIEPFLTKDNFYSHFPMVMAMNDMNDRPFKYNLTKDYGLGSLHRRKNSICIWTDEEELLFPPQDIDYPLYHWANKIHIANKKTNREGYTNKEFGRDYIFDLQETIDIKNFKHNYTRFERDNPNVKWEDAKMIDAFRYIGEWFHDRYKRSKSNCEIPDIGHTVYLCSMYEKFPELRAKVITIDGEIKAFSLWGPLAYNRAVHIILKCDTSLTYLSDYARYRTYLDMLVDKFETVNDGGDMGVHGLRMYKLKLRPKYVIPLYSWVIKTDE